MRHCCGSLGSNVLFSFPAGTRMNQRERCACACVCISVCAELCDFSLFEAQSNCELSNTRARISTALNINNVSYYARELLLGISLVSQIFISCFFYSPLGDGSGTRKKARKKTKQNKTKQKTRSQVENREKKSFLAYLCQSFGMRFDETLRSIRRRNSSIFVEINRLV